MRALIGKSFQLCTSLTSNHFRFCRKMIIERCLTTLTNADAKIPPQPLNSEKRYNENVTKIVNEISHLTLFEVSELNELLKKTLNIPDAPMMAFGTMPVTGAAPAEVEDEDTGAKTVQTSFTVRLNKFDETKKVMLIKEVKNIIDGMNLVQSKKFVESLPQVLKANIPKDEADKLKDAVEAAGGYCTIE